MVLCSIKVSAQDHKDFRYYDSLTFSLGEKQHWDSLISVYKDAVSHQFDWYYLEMRAGIAFYNKKNYEDALFCFRKAYKYNSDDVNTQEYLYYSLLFSGRTDEARAFLHEMNPDLIDRIKPAKNPIVSGVYIEGGMAFSNNFSKNQQIIRQETTPNDYTEADLNNNIRYFNLGLTHHIGKRITIYQAYSYVGIDKLKQIRLNIAPPYNLDAAENYKINQQQYYLQMGWASYNKISIKPAFHYLYNKFSTIYWSGDSIYPNLDKQTQKIISEYLFSLMLQKEYRKFTLGINASWSNLDKGTQLQGGLSLNYLFQNWHALRSTTNLDILSDKNSDKTITLPKLRVFFSERLSLPLTPRLYTGVSATVGNLCHANEMNGLYVYNSSDAINYKVGFDASYYLNQHFSLSLFYNFIDKSNNYFKENNNVITINHYNYNNHFLIGAIQWKI